MRKLTQLCLFLVMALVSVVLVAGPAHAATTLQSTVLSPVDGRVTSSPDEPHHTPYDGDYAFDVATTGAVYARYRNTNGALSFTVANISRACASGVFEHGGDKIVLNVYINGAKVGTVTYAHMTRFPYGVGAGVPPGARIGDAVTGSDGVYATSCWGGPHVHVEPRNDVRYGCFMTGLLGTIANGSTPLGLIGGRAGDRQEPGLPTRLGDAERQPAVRALRQRRLPGRWGRACPRLGDRP